MIDWTLITPVSLWQTIATIAVIIVAFFIIVRLLMRFWPWLRKVMALFDALGQLPKFIKDTLAFIVKFTEFMQRTDETLTGQDAKIEEIHHQTHDNNGSSLKDSQGRTEKEVAQLVESVGRIELGVKGMYDRMDKADRTAEDLQHELEVTRPKPPAPRKRPTNKETK